MALSPHDVASIASQVESLVTNPPSAWLDWNAEQATRFKSDVEKLRQVLRQSHVKADSLREEICRVGQWYGRFIHVPMEKTPRRIRKGKVQPVTSNSTFEA